MAPGAPIDVLVIGSGAAGLAAAVSADAAGAQVAVATKTTLQACNSAKAQGGIQAALGEDDSPDIHAEDVMRSSHDTADPRLVEVLTSEAGSAIAWLERAYSESQGPATRFQWGTNYVRGLIRMRPDDESAVRDATLAVLGELDGPNRIYRRSRARLETLDADLRAWNAGGAHAPAITAIRERMAAICAEIPAAEDAALASCAGFLSEDAG